MPTTEKVHNVVEPLQRLLVPIASLDTLPGNARKGDVEAVAASFAKYGQRKPLVAKKSEKGGIVTAGNHGLLAARTLGWTHVAAIVLDEDEVTAKGFALADNRTHDLGAYDESALLALLEEVHSAGELPGTGYTEGDLASLMESLAEQERDDNRGLGDEGVISFTLVFDDERQQSAWYDLVRMLRALYEEDTLGGRILAYVEHLRSTGDLEAG